MGLAPDKENPMHAEGDEVVRESESRYYRDHARELAGSDGEAKARFDLVRHDDPLPEIAPALLNSADIFSYVAKTGMLYPFDPDRLSGASYEVRVKGRVIYWVNGEKKTTDLNDGSDSFTLKSNSIAFVTLEPTFRLPDYIALRFNLKISHVYKGLLLGTGPLVDPGFVGRLSIPLHNLTSNEYVFHGLDEMIEMEFTKLSPNHAWLSTGKPHEGEAMYKRTWIKPGRTVEEYTGKALRGSNNKGIESSLPSSLSGMQKNIESAKAEVAELSKRVRTDSEKVLDDSKKQARNSSIVSVIGVVSFLVALATIGGFCIEQIISLGSAYDDNTAALQGLIEEYQQEIDGYEQEKEQDRQTIEDLKRTVADLRNQMENPGGEDQNP